MVEIACSFPLLLGCNQVGIMHVGSLCQHGCVELQAVEMSLPVMTIADWLVH